MAHRLRHDRPGSWHHVYARGIARRTLFESTRDIRVFKYFLAREVRRGTLEVHAYSFLTTHTHQLFRSPRGELSVALKRVFAGFSRWFNRSRRRDGPLFRGRFGSRPVTSDADRRNVVAYIDANAVLARLAPVPEAYAHGSARHWTGSRVPPWFSTSFVARVLGMDGPASPGAREAYRRAFAPRGDRRLARLIEARLAHGAVGDDPLDDLVAAAPPRVRAWMVRKAALADRTAPGIPVVDVESVEEAWKAGAQHVAGEARGRRGPGRPLARLLRIALLRDLGGLRYADIAARCRTSPTEARTCYRLHAERLARDPAYAAACLSIVQAAIAAVHRPPPGGG